MTAGAIPPNTDINAWAERNRLSGEYLPRIATATGAHRQELICELAAKLFASWARRRVNLVRSLDDIPVFDLDQGTHLSLIVLPQLSGVSLDDQDMAAIDVAMAGAGGESDLRMPEDLLHPGSCHCSPATTSDESAEPLATGADQWSALSGTSLTMRLRFWSVVSEITGVTGLAIADAILEGERNPAVPAKLRDHRIHASEEIVQKSLVGNWKPEHLFTLKQSRHIY